jgi:transposase
VRGMKISQEAKDLGLHENMLRKWLQDHTENGAQVCAVRGKQRRDDAEVTRLGCQLAKTKAERDILRNAIALFTKEPL